MYHHIYADNQKLYLSFSNLHHILIVYQESMTVCDIKQWLSVNVLKINADKAGVIIGT